MGAGVNNSQKNASGGSRWMAVVIALPALALWEILSRTGAVSPLFFPPPSRVAQTTWEMMANGELPQHILVTLSRLLGGFTLGAIPALIVGALTGWSRRCRAAVDPIVAAFHPMPKTALLPIFMILLGLAEAPKLAVTALGAFFPVAISTMAGVRQISPIHFEVAENYHVRGLGVLRHVVFPGSLPLVLSGARLGFNSALHIVIAVELLTARRGLGSVIWFAWETMRTEELYTAIAVTAILGIVFNLLLRWLMHRLVPWQREDHLERPTVAYARASRSRLDPDRDPKASEST